MDLVGHGRRHDAAEAAGSLLAEVARLDRVEPERRDVAVRFAQAERHDGECLSRASNSAGSNSSQQTCPFALIGVASRFGMMG